ncbi:MAG: RAMP superfamily CRISPR-associated protein [Lachnospiraceae bacterium]|nr:RAMP superfamily CRISPR-associated protein [Lachnospiraceae bacterium]
MSKAIYTLVDKYVVHAVCAGPMHVGGAGKKSEVLIHPVSGLPFVQATGICGVLRAYCGQIASAKEVNSLFGDTSDTAESRIRFSDGLFIRNENLRMELRPRLALDPKTGTAAAKKDAGLEESKSGQKFDMQYVGSGSELQFEIFHYDATEEETRLLLGALAALDAHEIQFGGQKSNGCGYIKIQKLLHGHYDMTRKEDRAAWIQESEDGMEPVALAAVEKTLHSDAYEVEILAETEGELLVKGIAVEKFGKDEPKATNIKDASGRYVIPGSSVKGAIRNRMEMIAGYLGISKELVFESFGRASESENEGMRGSLRFRDVAVGDEEGRDCALRTRIHIDKFTGGVMNGALFSELNVFGDLKLCINVADRRNAKAVTGLLLLALRDLAYKMYALGSGQSVGKGYLNVKEIHVRDLRQEKECTLNGKFELSGGREVAEACLEALRNY